MPNLKNISLKKLLQLNKEEFEQYHNVLKYLIPKDTIKNKKAINLTDLSFSEVTMLRMGIDDFEQVIKSFCKLFSLTEKQFLNLDVKNFYHGFNWMVGELQIISNSEQSLSSEPDLKWINAGIDQLDRFGAMNTVISLAKDFSVTPMEVESWPYKLVFMLMMHSKVSGEINKRYIESNSQNG